jgi:hypothetical protein
MVLSLSARNGTFLQYFSWTSWPLWHSITDQKLHHERFNKPTPKSVLNSVHTMAKPLSHLAWYRYLPVLGCYFDLSLLPPVPVFWKFWNQRTSSSGFFLKEWTSSFHEMTGSFIEGYLVDPLSILIWSIAVQMTLRVGILFCLMPTHRAKPIWQKNYVS